MTKKLIIFPFGGNAREASIVIHEINKKHNTWELLGFIDDNSKTWGKFCCGIEVLGGKEVLRKVDNYQLLAVPGNPDNCLIRKKIIQSLHLDISSFATIIHPSCAIAGDSKIGHNTILMANSVVGPKVEIGNHCVVLPNTVVSHDSIIKNYCCLGSNISISGNVIIGPSSFVGSGTSIRENISIGEKSLIGIGSNIVSNVPSSVIVAGNPAKILRKNNQ